MKKCEKMSRSQTGKSHFPVKDLAIFSSSPQNFFEYVALCKELLRFSNNEGIQSLLTSILQLK